MKIREMTAEDLFAVSEIEKECFSVPWTYEMLQESLENPHYVFLVAENDEGNVAGYAGMTVIFDEGDICNIAVLKEERRKGIGDMLLSALLSEALKRGVSTARLEVRATNLPAVCLYEKHGFKPLGRRKDYYTFPTEDALIYGVFLC